MASRLGLIAMFLFLASCNNVAYVDSLVLVNPTEYDVLVEVKGTEDTSWLSLGTANRNADTLNEEVIDMGETWVFRFRYLGEELGENEISRSQLVMNGWRYEIPQQVGEQLREKGYPPSVE